MKAAISVGRITPPPGVTTIGAVLQIWDDPLDVQKHWFESCVQYMQPVHHLGSVETQTMGFPFTGFCILKFTDVKVESVSRPDAVKVMEPSLSVIKNTVSSRIVGKNANFMARLNLGISLYVKTGTSSFSSPMATSFKLGHSGALQADIESMRQAIMPKRAQKTNKTRNFCTFWVGFGLKVIYLWDEHFIFVNV